MDAKVQSFQCKYSIGSKRCSKRSVQNRLYCSQHIKISRLEKPDECPVCMDHFKKETKHLRPCGHWVCIECIINSGKSECPLCRQKVYLSKSQRNILTRNRHRQEVKAEEEMFDMLVEEYGENGVEEEYEMEED